MNRIFLKLEIVMILAFMLTATNSWAMDADDDDAANDAPAATQDADAKPDVAANRIKPPPHRVTHTPTLPSPLPSLTLLRWPRQPPIHRPL
jgi:hypothetical protein